jgi:hypothetical protein
VAFAAVFTVRDPDGNRITLGQEVDRQRARQQ